MRDLIPKASVVLFVSLILIFALGVTNSIAQQKIKIAGKQTGATTTLDSIIVGDVDGHVISLSRSEGVNVSTGKHTFMDGAQFVSVGYGDYVMGNGPAEGYGQMSTDGDSVFRKTCFRKPKKCLNKWVHFITTF